MNTNENDKESESCPRNRPWRPVGSEMLRIPHCLDSRLTDGGEVSPMHLPRSTPQKLYFCASGTHLCYRLSKPPGLARPEGLGKTKKCIHHIGNRNFRLVP
jgi:hypothetical protein